MKSFLLAFLLVIVLVFCAYGSFAEETDTLHYYGGGDLKPYKKHKRYGRRYPRRRHHKKFKTNTLSYYPEKKHYRRRHPRKRYNRRGHPKVRKSSYY